MVMDIIYEDDEILVINKPAGIATQAGKVACKDLESECKKYRKEKGEKPEIYVVHRLDQPVSGILVFAKTKESAAILSKGMSADSFSKDYKATVYKKGILLSEGTLTDYLLKDVKTNSSRVVSKETSGAKEARLSYKVEEDFGDTANLLVHLQTGRHHQIRVQLANSNMPIVGDLKYGTKESTEYSKEKGIGSVQLCAYHLEFIHPKTKKKMAFSI